MEEAWSSSFETCLAPSFLVRLENNIQNHLGQFKPPPAPAYMLTKYVKGLFFICISPYTVEHTLILYCLQQPIYTNALECHFLKELD